MFTDLRLSKLRLTGYFTKMQDANEVSFYYADGISGVDSGTAFVQEILEGIDKKAFRD